MLLLAALLRGCGMSRPDSAPVSGVRADFILPVLQSQRRPAAALTFLSVSSRKLFQVGVSAVKCANRVDFQIVTIFFGGFFLGHSCITDSCRSRQALASVYISPWLTRMPPRSAPSASSSAFPDPCFAHVLFPRVLKWSHSPFSCVSLKRLQLGSPAALSGVPKGAGGSTELRRPRHCSSKMQLHIRSPAATAVEQDDCR